MDIFRFELTDTADEGDQQILAGKGLPGEEFAKVARVQPFGFASAVPDGAHGLGVAVNGRRDEVAVLGLEVPAKRPRNLPKGVSAVYNAFGILWRLLSTKADLDHGGKDHHARNVGKYKVEAADWIHMDGKAVYLGRAPYFPVMTSAGPSQHVFAGIAPAAPDTPSGSI